jgi:hypothetical protein
MMSSCPDNYRDYIRISSYKINLHHYEILKQVQNDTFYIYYDTLRTIRVFIFEIIFKRNYTTFFSYSGYYHNHNHSLSF